MCLVNKYFVFSLLIVSQRLALSIGRCVWGYGKHATSARVKFGSIDIQKVML